MLVNYVFSEYHELVYTDTMIFKIEEVLRLAQKSFKFFFLELWMDTRIFVILFKKFWIISIIFLLYAWECPSH